VNKKSTVSIVALVAGNLLPLVMVALGYWGIMEILALYWLESAIVGFFTVLKVFFASAPVPQHSPVTFQMLWTAPHTKTLPFLVADLGFIGKLLLSVFFLFPFGMYMALIGMMLYLLLPLMGPGAMPTLLGLKWGILGLFLSHAVAFAWDYLALGEFRRTSPGDCVNDPFHRLAIIMLALVSGGGISHTLGNSVYIMSVFVLAKIVIDLRPPEGYIGGDKKNGKRSKGSKA
jgi:hypothetical protein